MPSSSPDRRAPALQVRPEAAEGEVLLTFDELPLGTAISTQYVDQGIVFGGDRPFLTTDRANPTSPVLSGSPRFQGAIEGRFVRPGRQGTPAVVARFSLDAGYFDALGSVRLQWFDRDGRLIGQRASSRFGIQRFVVEGAGIASWRIEIIETEPAGFAIDNLRFRNGVDTAILFREKREGDKDGTWGLAGDEVPGFDHVALSVDDRVYESHPGYPPGTYTDPAGRERRFVPTRPGVQSVHSRGTFEHDAKVGEVSPVIDFLEIPIDRDVAEAMRSQVQTQVGSGAFQLLDFRDLAGIERSLRPAAQKGGLNADGQPSYTCVGLVEWAAERSGYRDGQGVVPNRLESFWLIEPGVPPRLREIPLLSPQLMKYCLQFQGLVSDAGQWVQGFFDPVDFLLVDPLGRRLGYTAQTGRVSEIPFAFFSGDGQVEQFLIPNPLAGRYRLELRGTGGEVSGAVESANEAVMVHRNLAPGEPMTENLMVQPTPGSPGDLDSDGDVDGDDRDLLQARLDSFTDRIGDAGDLDGDGRFSSLDVALLEQACTRPACRVESSLRTCQPGSRRLCLQGGRFRVEVDWRDFQGNEGQGQVTSFRSDDSGLFWFFNEDNWEMLVKVLDGCPVNGHFWVFSAATTTVEYTLTVTDTASGRVRRYYNQFRTPSRSVTDTQAFETCSAPLAAADRSPGPPPSAPVQGPGTRTAESPRIDSLVEPRVSKALAAGSCVASATVLCLNQNRFKVEVLWEDLAGNDGRGRSVPFGSDDSGLLWFFNPDNWEMLVKVLDGCGVNNRVWVFAAATTNVGYVLRVTDTLTQQAREYVNPVGRSAPAVTDTGAFASCR